MSSLVKNSNTHWRYQVAPIHQGSSRKPVIPEEAMRLFKRFTDKSYVKVELKDGTVMSTQAFIAGYRDIGKKQLPFFYILDGKKICYLPETIERVRYKTRQGIFILLVTDGGYLIEIPLEDGGKTNLVLNCKPKESLTEAFKTIMDLLVVAVNGNAKRPELFWNSIGDIWAYIWRVENGISHRLGDLDLDGIFKIKALLLLNHTRLSSVQPPIDKTRKYKNELPEEDYRYVGETFLDSINQIENVNRTTHPRLKEIDSKFYRELFYVPSVYNRIYVKASKRKIIGGVVVKVEVRAYDLYYRDKKAPVRLGSTIKKHLTGLGGVVADIKSVDDKDRDGIVVFTLTAANYDAFVNANTKLTKLLLGLMLKG